MALADVKSLSRAGHADIEEPNHCVALRSVSLVCSISDLAEVREKKDHIGFATLYRMNRSHDDPRRFPQGPNSASRRDGKREPSAGVKLRFNATRPPLKQPPRI